MSRVLVSSPHKQIALQRLRRRTIFRKQHTFCDRQTERHNITRVRTPQPCLSSVVTGEGALRTGSGTLGMSSSSSSGLFLLQRNNDNRAARRNVSNGTATISVNCDSHHRHHWHGCCCRCDAEPQKTGHVQRTTTTNAMPETGPIQQVLCAAFDEWKLNFRPQDNGNNNSNDGILYRMGER